MVERKMWSITCNECGKKSQVPFKPDGKRPVYCPDCYKKKRKKSKGYWQPK